MLPQNLSSFKASEIVKGYLFLRFDAPAKHGNSISAEAALGIIEHEAVDCFHVSSLEACRSRHRMQIS